MLWNRILLIITIGTSAGTGKEVTISLVSIIVLPTTSSNRLEFILISNFKGTIGDEKFLLGIINCEMKDYNYTQDAFRFAQYISERRQEEGKERLDYMLLKDGNKYFISKEDVVSYTEGYMQIKPTFQQPIENIFNATKYNTFSLKIGRNKLTAKVVIFKEDRIIWLENSNDSKAIDAENAEPFPLFSVDFKETTQGLGNDIKWITGLINLSFSNKFLVFQYDKAHPHPGILCTLLIIHKHLDNAVISEWAGLFIGRLQQRGKHPYSFSITKDENIAFYRRSRAISVIEDIINLAQKVTGSVFILTPLDTHGTEKMNNIVINADDICKVEKTIENVVYKFKTNKINKTIISEFKFGHELQCVFKNENEVSGYFTAHKSTNPKIIKIPKLLNNEDVLKEIDLYLNKFLSNSKDKQLTLEYKFNGSPAKSVNVAKVAPIVVNNTENIVMKYE